MDRVKPKELDEATVTLRQDKIAPFSSVLCTEPVAETIYFTMRGKQDYFGTKFGEEVENGYPIIRSETWETYAKINYKGKSPSCWLKIDVYGFPFDPTGMNEFNRGRQDKNTKWVEVDEQAFLYYLQFLKTLNRQFIRLAMNEMTS